MSFNINDPLNKDLWRNVVDTMSEGLVVIQPDGRITLVNHALEKITGYSREELINRPCTIFNCDACELVRGSDRQWWCVLFNPAHGAVESRRCQIRRKDGSYAVVLKNASPLKEENGQVAGVVETVTDLTELEKRERQIAELHRRLVNGHGFRGMIGRSDAMRRTFEIIEKAAMSDGPVVIYGESGTGKELAARAVHDLGRTREGPFIQLNCASLNEALLESELFGHVKGAFTGAYRHRQGRFEAAHGGDIFLDEIGDMPLSTQVKLLRVLETKQIERVGDHTPVAVDVRIIAATHRDLERHFREKKFRPDLFYRINVIPIHLPPLRDRLEDLPLLVEFFLENLQRNHLRDIAGVSPEVMDAFLSYTWPGNVRELKGALEYAWVIADQGRIGLQHLPPRFHGSPPHIAPGLPARPAPRPPEDQKAALLSALKECGGNQTHAARALGVSRVTVWSWIKKYGIELERID